MDAHNNCLEWTHSTPLQLDSITTIDSWFLIRREGFWSHPHDMVLLFYYDVYCCSSNQLWGSVSTAAAALLLTPMYDQKIHSVRYPQPSSMTKTCGKEKNNKSFCLFPRTCVFGWKQASTKSLTTVVLLCPLLLLMHTDFVHFSLLIKHYYERATERATSNVAV